MNSAFRNKKVSLRNFKGNLLRKIFHDLEFFFNKFDFHSRNFSMKGEKSAENKVRTIFFYFRLNRTVTF